MELCSFAWLHTSEDKWDFSPPTDFICHVCNQIARIIIGTVPFLQTRNVLKSSASNSLHFNFLVVWQHPIQIWRHSCETAVLLPWRPMMHAFAIYHVSSFSYQHVHDKIFTTLLKWPLPLKSIKDKLCKLSILLDNGLRQTLMMRFCLEVWFSSTEHSLV